MSSKVFPSLAALVFAAVVVGCSGSAAEDFKPEVKTIPGSEVVKTFQGHLPCLEGRRPPDCERLQAWLVLYEDSQTREPTVYTLGYQELGTRNAPGEKKVAEGHWTSHRGTAAHAGARVVQLDEKAPELMRLQWLVDGNTLLGIEADGKVRGGDAGAVYALAKVAP